ncbi:Peptidyl-prolyl cis-trans isomerase cyp10 [Bulinus truncatus]|nr:Peptidyl-prolyl cis-trans isomerase cyp10 [Bulinus truncatus]
MTPIKQAVQQSMKQLVKFNGQPQKRVVSTSLRKDQGVGALQMEAELVDSPIRQCPFRMSPSNETDAVDVPDTREVSSVQPFNKIPGPKGLPIVGTLLDYLQKDGPKFNKMFEVQRQRSIQYGDVYFEKIADFESVVISSPHEYNRLVRAEGKYPIRREMAPMSFYNKLKGYALGIVNAQGEEWYRLRTVVSKKMLKLSEVSSISGEVGQVADDFVHRLSYVRDSLGEVPALEQEIFKWAMESIGVFLFDERIGCLGDQPTPKAMSFIENLAGFFRTLQALMYSVPLYQIWPTKTWKQFEKFSDNVMELGKFFINKKIESIRENKDSKSSLVSYLVNNGTLSDKEINGMVTEVLSAAVETTSSATVWSLYNLAKNPRVQEDLFHQITEAKSKNGGSLSAEEMGKLPLVKAVLKETLRMYPISYTSSRYISDDIELGGYKIPAGTHVQANLYGMFNNPEYFPEPKKFMPERWVKDNKMDQAVKSAAQLVWGHGNRMCLGRRLAEQEIHMTLSKIVESFQLSYHGDDVEPTLNTTMMPDRPVKIKFTPRV